MEQGYGVKGFIAGALPVIVVVSVRGVTAPAGEVWWKGRLYFDGSRTRKNCDFQICAANLLFSPPLMLRRKASD